MDDSQVLIESLERKLRDAEGEATLFRGALERRKQGVANAPRWTASYIISYERDGEYIDVKDLVDA